MKPALSFFDVCPQAFAWHDPRFRLRSAGAVLRLLRFVSGRLHASHPGASGALADTASTLGAILAEASPLYVTCDFAIDSPFRLSTAQRAALSDPREVPHE